MSRPSITKTHFGKVYVALGLLLGVSIWLFLLAMDRALVPAIVSTRVENVERLVRSNFAALDVFDTRQVRDELVASKFIPKDQDFDIVRPGKSEIEPLADVIKKCTRWIGEQTCTTEFGTAIVFSSSRKPLEQTSSFAVVLSNAKIDQNLGLAPWAFLGIITITAMFLSVAFGIRIQEKNLLKKIALLSESASKVPSLLGMKPSPSGDEIEAASSTIEQLTGALQVQQDKIATYRGWLARQTRHEQLKQTLAHSAHDLRAPLEETADFLKHLPDLQDGLEPEIIRQTMKSLEARVRGGLRSLDNALRLTTDQTYGREPFSLNELFENLSVQFSAHEKPKLAKLMIQGLPLGNDAILLGDATGFQSALWNMIENAVQARRDSHITIAVEVLEHSLLSIRLSDNGPGIARDLLEDVFQEFVTTKASGTGLGLASARRIVESMYGTLRALDSSSGATFEIRIPAVLTSQNLAPNTGTITEVRHV